MVSHFGTEVLQWADVAAGKPSVKSPRLEIGLPFHRLFERAKGIDWTCAVIGAGRGQSGETGLDLGRIELPLIK